MLVEIGFDVVDGQNEPSDLRFIYNTGDWPALQVGERLEFNDPRGNNDIVLEIEGLIREYGLGPYRRYRADASAQRGNAATLVQVLKEMSCVSNITVDGVEVS
ncbi:MAG: hypothetical protein PVI21_03800 [Candidatus Woesebacteria bacterium]|jgi:hypothetical protein